MLSANNHSTSHGTRAKDKENIMPRSKDKAAQNRKDTNKKYYERNKEKRRMLESDHQQKNNESIFATAEVIHKHHVICAEENNQIYSGLTHETLDEVGGSSEVHVNQVIPDDILLEDPYHSIFDGIPEVHSILEGSNICVHCGAKRFKHEFATFCCMSGKTKLASSQIPNELYHLFTSEEELSKIFRDNIRAYNTKFSFTSMGVELDDDLSNMKSGVYTFRANGAIYHRIDQLVPRDGLPRYLQLYFYDSETDFTHRLQWPNIDRKIIQVLVGVLSTNPYATTFRSLRELGPLDNYRVTLNASVELDQRVYNRPTTSEVAGIWVEARDGVSINEAVGNEENIVDDIEGAKSKKGRNTVTMRRKIRVQC
ncbi:unnamed protein product [Lactuca saligna]|uniref:Helitron helicase-like domain-containing protein n=1 Tax=Lactuca saligna TaxID=75948 RepID=A0AA35Z2E2_LACSI|nr:unnamed protein product [Lactuca saligna]